MVKRKVKCKCSKQCAKYGFFRHYVKLDLAHPILQKELLLNKILGKIFEF